MLSQKEKNEMLKDARSVERRDTFRRARNAATQLSDVSLDSYLKFLSSVHQVFSKVSAANIKTSRVTFKL